MKKLFTLCIASVLSLNVFAAKTGNGLVYERLAYSGGVEFLAITGADPSYTGDIHVVFGTVSYRENGTGYTGLCTQINAGALYGNARVKSVKSTTSSVAPFPSQCFMGCSNLSSVDLSAIDYASFEIPDYTFRGCTSLSSVQLPESMYRIGPYAFQGCPITRITINTVAQINPYAFAGCNQLTAVTWLNKQQLVEYGGTAELGVNTPVSKTPFYAILSQITEVALCTDYSDGVFKSLPYLRTLSISPDVTKIGAGAFSGCSSLGKTPNTEINTMYSFGDQCFANCTSLTFDLKLEKKYTAYHIGESAFANTAITSLVVGTGNNEGCSIHIGKDAFAYCTQLGKVELHGEVIADGTGVFTGCTGVKKLYIGTIPTPATLAEDTYRGKGSYFCRMSNLEELEINRTGAVYPHEFYNLKNLKKVTVSSRVSRVGENAFYGCTGIKELVWDVPEMTDYSSASVVPFAGAQLSKGVLGSHVKHVPAFLFAGQTEMREFANDVHENSFYSIESIGAHAFEGLTGLVYPYLIMSKDLKKIDSYAFRGCSGITEIDVQSSYTPATLGEDVFAGVNGGNLRTVKLVVPKSAVSQYQAAEGWCEFYGTCPNEEGIEDVPSDQVQSTKLLRNGQLYLMYKGTMYDVQGRKIDACLMPMF